MLKEGQKTVNSDTVLGHLVDKDPDKLLEAFKVSISKGYPTNYNPEVLKESRTEEVASSPSNGKPYDIDEDFLI